MIKSILGGKSKNLFDISKVIDTNSVKRIGNTLVCSTYGTSIGTLESLCPTLKASDTITISFKCTSQGAASGYMNINNHIFRSGSVFIASELGLSNPIYLYNTDYAHIDIPNKTTYSDIQIEKGSTATEYVPHELTSYKSIMKVSDVCQLMDKSKYPATQTINGITWTNNGDGTITANGDIISGEPYSNYIIPIPQFKEVKNNHKYALFSGIDNINITYIECIFWLAGTDSYFLTNCVETNFENTFGFTIPQGEYLSFQRVELRIHNNHIANNTAFKPQLFDLTEMFGAGNEPKTVAEFKAKFPNDYYPYSPSCFVTSFDERMPCKTRNLINAQQIYQISQFMDVTIWQGEINYVCTFSYELSMFEPNTGGSALFEFAYSDGTYSYIVHRDKYKVLSQITDSKKLTRIGLVNWSNVKGILSNIQLEKGTTATDYVPYGYV